MRTWLKMWDGNNEKSVFVLFFNDNYILVTDKYHNCINFIDSLQVLLHISLLKSTPLLYGIFSIGGHAQFPLMSLTMVIIRAWSLWHPKGT